MAAAVTTISKSQEPRAKSQEPRAKSQEPRAKSQEPRAKSQEPRAKSQEPRAKSQEPACNSDVESVSGVQKKKPAQASSRAGSRARTAKADQNASTEALIKSKHRVKKFGEVFTPPDIVRQMCDLCEPDISRIDSKVFEPTCGNGNFLVEILRRKLAKIRFKTQKQFEFDILIAVSNVYAVDIQYDNVVEARERLKSEIFNFVGKRKSSFEFINNIDIILKRAILLGDTLKQKSKLNFYDFQPDRKTFTFEISRHSLEEIEKTYAKTKKSIVENIAQTLREFEAPPPASPPKRRLPKRPATNQTSLITQMELPR